MKKFTKFKSKDFNDGEKGNRHLKSKHAKKHKKLIPRESLKLSKKDLFKIIDEEE